MAAGMGTQGWKEARLWLGRLSLGDTHRLSTWAPWVAGCPMPLTLCPSLPGCSKEAGACRGDCRHKGTSSRGAEVSPNPKLSLRIWGRETMSRSPGFKDALRKDSGAQGPALTPDNPGGERVGFPTGVEASGAAPLASTHFTDIGAKDLALKAPLNHRCCLLLVPRYSEALLKVMGVDWPVQASPESWSRTFDVSGVL